MELLDKSFEVSADGNATISDLFVISMFYQSGF
jgi:hypothetical protein